MGRIEFTSLRSNWELNLGRMKLKKGLPEQEPNVWLLYGHIIIIIIIIINFGGTVMWTQNFVLWKQVLNPLSRAPFHFGLVILDM
jgi:hypothetical protein